MMYMYIIKCTIVKLFDITLYVPLGSLGALWIFNYLLDLYVPLGRLGTSWTFRYILDL